MKNADSWAAFLSKS